MPFPHGTATAAPDKQRRGRPRPWHPATRRPQSDCCREIRGSKKARLSPAACQREDRSPKPPAPRVVRGKPVPLAGGNAKNASRLIWRVPRPAAAGRATPHSSGSRAPQALGPWRDPQSVAGEARAGSSGFAGLLRALPIGMRIGARDAPSPPQPGSSIGAFRRMGYGKAEQAFRGVHNGQPFTHIVRRRTQCLDCRQLRIDGTYENRPEG